MALTPERLDFLRRNSKVALDREGRWSMDGKPVEHPRVQRLFHRGVEVADGGFKLRVGQQWCWIQFIADTAFFVEKARVDGDTVVLTLADETEETLDPSTLTQGGEIDLYCTLSGGRRARFLRSALAALEPVLTSVDGALAVRLGGAVHSIGKE